MFKQLSAVNRKCYYNKDIIGLNHDKQEVNKMINCDSINRKNNI